MPQRAKTPPPPQDEIFMTISHPYPQHANMEVQEDIERVARWLGTIVAPEYFNAFYHKPSARNTVIIEVSKAIGDGRRKLLGKHIWKEFLLKPSEGEKGRASGVFYCVYQNIRDVQKEGWKRIDFEDTWFMPRDGRKHKSLYYNQAEWEEIVKADGVFCLPYPTSTRCEVPNEDPTNRGFCRPLPVDLFPIPILPEMPREVPGTLQWTKVKALPESAWAKQLPRSVKGKTGSQTTAQPNDQRGRTAPPRNNGVGPAVLANQSGVNTKSPGTLPPNLVINGNGKGKEREKNTPSTDMDELIARTVAMDLDNEEEVHEYYGAGLENVLASAGIVPSPALQLPEYDPIDHTGVGVHVSGVSIKPIVVEDSLWGDPVEDKKPKKDDAPLCELHGKVCSRGICKVYEKQKEVREYRKKLKDEQEAQSKRDGNGGPNNWRSGRGSRGTGRGTRGTPLQRIGGLQRDPGPRSPTNDTKPPEKANGHTSPKTARLKGGSDAKGNTAWGTNNNAWSPSEMGESAGPAEKPKPAGSDTKSNKAWGANNNAWSPSEMGESAGPAEKPKPAGSNTKSNKAWGANNNAWSPSEMGESSGPAEKPNPNPSVKGGDDDDDRPWNAPAAKGWSQSEIDGGSQADPWSVPVKFENKTRGKDTGLGKTRGPNPGGRGVPPKAPVKPSWGNTGAAKDWTPSELGMDDSVSQRGGGFRTPPTLEPGKKSWADQVEDEFDRASGDESSPPAGPAPDLEGDGDGADDGWVQSGKGKGKAKGKGQGKAKSATGWSDVTNQGIW